MKGVIVPFKSKAQRRKFAELLVAGKISPEVYEEWNRETGRKTHPERDEPKPRSKPRSKPRRAAKAAGAKPAAARNTKK